jgi:microcystin-dependent protein
MEAYMSMITPYGLTYVIRDWAQCRGQLLPIFQFDALFSLFGTLYGGDGRNTFALPNLQSRSPVGKGGGPGLSDIYQGEAAGREQINLNNLNMPAHDHGLDVTGQAPAATGGLAVSNDGANTGDPAGNFLGAGSGPTQVYTSTLTDPPGAQTGVIDVPGRSVQLMGDTQLTGGGQPFDTRNPYLGLNYQICIDGIYPSRG